MLRCKVLINLLNPKCRATSTFILHFALIHECIDAFYILFSALYTWFTLMWCRLESVRDFLIKLDIKLCMHLNSGYKHFFTKSCHEFESSAFAFVCFEISILLKLEISCLLLFSEGLKFQALEGLRSNVKTDDSS